MTRPESALRYLLFRSFVNRLAAQVKRVRSPRYALAFLAGAAYLYYFVGRGLARGFTASSTASTGDSSAYVLAYEALLVLSAILTWVVGAAEPAIGFTRADIQMLFPAPVSRGAVVRYKLAQTQLAILFSVLVWSLLLGRVHGSQRLLRTAALWVLFTTLYLHRVGASFVKVSAAQRGLSGIRRNIVPIAIVIAALGATAWGLAHTWHAVREAAGDGRFDEVVRILRGAPAIAVVLWPFHALVSPVFAANAGAWARSIPWALLLLAGCYAWVIRSAVGFEEAAMLRADRLAAEQARRRLSRQGKLRAGRPVRALQLAGRPWPAIVWKNVVAFQRIASPGRPLIFLVLTIAIVSVVARNEAALPQMVIPIGAMLLVYLAFFGAMLVRTDLQQDMSQVAMLRAFPLSARTIVAAEIGSTVLILWLFEMLIVLIGVVLGITLLRDTMRAGGWGLVRALPWAVAGLLVLPAVTALRVGVANAWAVLFPGWVQLGPGRPQGIEAIGANMLALAGSLLAHLLLMAVPAAAAVGVLWAAGAAASAPGRFPWWALIGAGAMFAAFAVGELWVIVQWLGGVLGRTDPSQVDAAAA